MAALTLLTLLHVTNWKLQTLLHFCNKMADKLMKMEELNIYIYFNLNTCCMSICQIIEI